MSRELIYRLTKKDFILKPFKGSGPGGQHRNKNSTAIRITHPDSGAVGECSEHKSQLQNKKVAFRRLVDSKKFKIWHTRKVYEFDKKKSIEQEVDEMMKPEFIKVEVKDENGRWCDEETKD